LGRRNFTQESAQKSRRGKSWNRRSAEEKIRFCGVRRPQKSAQKTFKNLRTAE
jgi:hypothetical protein